MHLINLIVNNLCKNMGYRFIFFFENWSRGTSHLKCQFIQPDAPLEHVCNRELTSFPL